MEEKIKKVCWGVAGIFLLTAGLLYAENSLAASFNIEIPNWLGTDNFETVAQNIIRVLRNFVAGIAILMLIIAGIVYIFSQGDQQRTTTAKRIMTGAIVGLVIILGAETILRELYIIFAGTGSPGPGMGTRLFTIVQRTMNLILSVLGMIGIIAFIWAAFLYLTSAGNEDQAELAKKQMKYAIFGLVIAVGALVIIKQIHQLLS